MDPTSWKCRQRTMKYKNDSILKNIDKIYKSKLIITRIKLSIGHLWFSSFAASGHVVEVLIDEEKIDD